MNILISYKYITEGEKGKTQEIYPWLELDNERKIFQRGKY